MTDYNGKTYEFVSKTELKPARKAIDEIIRQLQKNMRKHSITFIPVLIGSAKRHLVTRVVNGNTGFDFDYNFFIQKGSNIEAKKLKLLFIEELKRILDSTQYKDAENNTQSMTIKFVNKVQSTIIHSCDIAIVNECKKQNILIYNKKDDSYFWNVREYGERYEYKISNLLENGLWMKVQDEYLKLKNSNTISDKISFSLYLEAVNNVYNRYDWIK